MYTTLDYASDLGGLFGAISPFFTICLSIINFYSSYQFLMSDLFVEQKDVRLESITKKTPNHDA